jgi:hypothetical protein
MFTMYSPAGKECKVDKDQVSAMKHVGYSFEKPAPKAEEKTIQKEIPKVIAK